MEEGLCCGYGSAQFCLPEVKQNPERGTFPLTEPRRGGPASWPLVHASGSWFRAAAAKLSLQNWLLRSPCACRLHPPSWSCYPQSPGTGGPLNTGLSVASGEPRNLCPSQSVNWNTSKWSSWLPKDPQLCKNKPAAYAWQGQWVSAWSFLDQGFKWPF